METTKTTSKNNFEEVRGLTRLRFSIICTRYFYDTDKREILTSDGKPFQDR